MKKMKLKEPKKLLIIKEKKGKIVGSEQNSSGNCHQSGTSEQNKTEGQQKLQKKT